MYQGTNEVERILMKKIGDLFWTQLSMWECLAKENVSAYSKDGFHYELQVTTSTQVDNRWKAKNLTWAELSKAGIDLITLIPEPTHNWNRVMVFRISTKILYYLICFEYITVDDSVLKFKNIVIFTYANVFFNCFFINYNITLMIN